MVWEPVIGRSCVVRWNEPRLLEVAAVSDDTGWRHIHQPARRYMLYTDHTTISWTERAPRRSNSTGDMAALLALIAARTGLAPRTFDSELQAGGEVPSGVVVDTLRPDSTLPPSPSGIYVLASAPRRTWRGCLIACGIGIVLTVAGLLAGLWSLDALHAIVASEVVRAVTGWLNPVAACCLVFGGIIGILLLIAALNPWAPTRIFTIRADESGLTHETSHIAWSAIAAISRRTLGSSALYLVSSAADDTTILWTDRAPQAHAPVAGATAVTPTELATVVSARSGKPIQVMQRACLS